MTTTIRTIAAVVLLASAAMGCSGDRAVKIGPETWKVAVKPGGGGWNRAHDFAYEAAVDHCAAMNKQLKFVDAATVRIEPGHATYVFTCRAKSGAEPKRR